MGEEWLRRQLQERAYSYYEKRGARPGGDLEDWLQAQQDFIEQYKRDIDRSLLREALKLTPEQRVRKLTRLQRLAAELRSAGRRNKPST